MIDGLVQRVQNAPLAEKDPQAEQYLQQSLGLNPDALYILAQTVLVQGYALEQAQKQLADFKSQLQQQQPTKHTSFLGSIFGSNEPDRPAAPPPSQPAYATVPAYAQPQSYPQPYPQPGVYPQASPVGGGGFLRGAMQTAAGVAAGAVAFEGIESLMHGFGGHGGGSGLGSFGNDAPREEIVNNYYGDDSGREREHGSQGFLGNDDIEDRRDDPSGTQNDYADTGDDGSLGTDSSSDDSSGDDSSFS